MEEGDYRVSDSYAGGTVHAASNSGGGLVGKSYGAVVRSYAFGTVTGAGIGGLAGSADASATWTSSYWDVNASGLGTSAGGAPKTTVEMQDQNTFVGWDFTNTWTLDGELRPRLRWEIRPVMRGWASILGTVKCGQTLTAATLLTYTAVAPGNEISCQWKRNGVVIDGAASETYIPGADDVGKVITVAVSADGSNAQGRVVSSAISAVVKADAPAAPTAPTLASKTHTTVTLAAVAGREYRVNSGAWQDSNEFTLLTPETAYTFTTRVKETGTHLASAESQGTSVTTNAVPTMGGSVAISGSLKFGATLSVDASGITCTPATSGNVLSYQWKRDGSGIAGATGSTYTLVQDDIGKIVSVTVTADGTNAQGSVTGVAASAVGKADVSSPPAPGLASKTFSSVTLVANGTHEFSMDGGTWQPGETFIGLLPISTHTFRARVKETPTHNPSPASGGALFITSPPGIGGTVVIVGEAKFGAEMSISGIAYIPATSDDVPTYQWKRDGVVIAGATGPEYTPALEDITKTLSVTVTSDGVNAEGSVTSAATAAIDKADGPPAPSVPETAEVTFRSVTLAANAAHEFSMDGGAWQGGLSGHVFTGLAPESEHEFTARVKETATHKASEASGALTVTTKVQPVMGGSVDIAGVLQYDRTLEADISDITYTPTTSDDHPTYRWRRGDADIAGLSGAGSTYKLTAADIGQIVSVRVSADGDNADGSVLSGSTTSIEKADAAAPGSAPTVSSKTFNSVTLAANAAHEFCIDDGAWTDNNVFAGLLPSKEYSFTARFKETATHKASPASGQLTVTTDPDTNAPVWAPEPEFSAPSIGATWVALEWEGVTDNVAVTAFRVYRGGVLVGTTPAANYQVSGLIPLKPYDFKVEAGDGAGNWTVDGPELTVSTKSAPQEEPPPWIGANLNVKLEHWTGSNDVEVKCAAGAASYVLQLTGRSLSEPGGGAELVASTGIGTVVIPSNMLAGTELEESSLVNLTVGIVDKASLPEDVRLAVGDRPLIRLSLDVDGEPAAWSNPDAPVTVAIPYTPTPEELLNPEAITVWYIDGSGNAVEVPSGRFDPATGTVTFTTTHFSDYAIVFVEKTFDDLVTVPWAKKQVEVLASKGIIKGTAESTFSPDAEVTRADFLLLLVRALGLTAREVGSFADVLPSDYYHDAVGIAKTLGITNGVDGQRFDPNSSITRQDMMALAGRALTLARRLVRQPGDLTTFSDAESVASYAVDSVASLVASGLVAGDGGKINPLGDTTRAEAAVFLYRAYNMR